MSDKRLFKVRFEGGVIIELDQAVLDQVDDEWRSNFYSLESDEDIATHIGFNLIFNQWKLSHLDGFANLEDSMAKVEEDVEFYAIWSEELDEDAE